MLYPAMLKLEGKRVVVIGGGKVAARKVISLVEAKATVQVVSPEISSEMAEFIDHHPIDWKQKIFEPEDLQGAVLVFAATNDRKVNAYIQQCASGQQLVNIVDDPAGSSFFVPATLKKGKLAIAVSTSGGSPGLSKKIIQELSTQYDEQFISFIDFLAECREQIKHQVSDPVHRKQLLTELIQSDLYEQLKEADDQERVRLLNILIDSRR
ncbi:NAD(P)-dependent oxidoreductase [Bacillus sp. REN10]|uniref:precorrin-2 dehydrogenase/sirohydrochlorin ferrochelatase family protein n=1 Tax=Bacillus sp. REN10 TaxID=2782541 RepID=UPI00193B66B6|nr:NAD(P)-dependent oxidoreductase [Bacillus sp. REN10]